MVKQTGCGGSEPARNAAFDGDPGEQENHADYRPRNRQICRLANGFARKLAEEQNCDKFERHETPRSIS
jgi:hypothetical protein